MKYHKLAFQPGDLRIEVKEGTTIMEAMNEAGLGFDFPCGGRGTCGKCRVKVLEGVNQPTNGERELLDSKELDQGIRLACLTKIHSEVSIQIPESKRSQHNILVAAEERSFKIEPHVRKVFVEVQKPSLGDQRSDFTRLKQGIAAKYNGQSDLEATVSLLRELPETMREAEQCLTAVIHDNRLLGIEKQDTTGTLLGMAFDIGTTTIVGYLLDLNSGKELAIVSTLNPQAKFGADVISRITYSNQGYGLVKLHETVIQAINNLIGEACSKAGTGRQQIYAVSIAANTTMHHLFMGISPRNIAVSPYVSAVSEAVTAESRELKIDMNQAGKIFILPNIAGFVGADTTAVLLATELDRSEDIKLIIDIGTNGEIALGSKDKMYACSAAAGPAFEGAQISSGMRGAHGAIDHVFFRDNLDYSVIGGGSPRGICGSALLDVVAGLVELGLIDKRGKFIPAEKLADPAAKMFKDYLVEHEGSGAFLLADGDITSHSRPIMVTQNDIRELQLAKGAMAAGIRVLMEKSGIQMEEIKEVLLAGAFGNYLNPHSACVIGLIPRELEGKIKMIGNAAGTGAKQALLSAKEFFRTNEIAASVNFVELGSYPKFNSIFAESMYFKNP